MRDKSQNVPVLPDHLNYEKLRELGLSYLQSVSGNVWTDYNLHDPGVTTLEMLCYALMDLGFRSSFDIKDLLTPQGSTSPSLEGFYQAHEILPGNPVTLEDLKIFVLENVPGVRNIWFETGSRAVDVKGVFGGASNTSRIEVDGIYRMTIDLEDEEVLKSHDYYRRVVGRGVAGKYVNNFPKHYKEAYKDYIVNCFHRMRNLCEDIDTGQVAITEHIPVGICAEIEISRDADCRYILNRINGLLAEYVCPAIPLHSVDEMLAKGKTPDEIFQVTLPKYGFVDRDEMSKYQKRTTLYVSDALNLIMGIKGVRSVSHLHFKVDPAYKECVEYNNDFKLELKDTSQDSHEYSFVFRRWPELVNRDDYKSSSLRQTLLDDTHLSEITFDINRIPFNVGTEIPVYCLKKKKTVIVSEKDEIPGFSPALPLPESEYKFTDNYFSVQNYFPDIFMIGREGISEDESDERKAERLQFKAYLLFFEQILADYLAQLSSITKLYSWSDSGKGYDLTYFSTFLSDDEIKDLSAVLKSYDGYQDTVYGKSVSLNRRNRLLDHLLARFNEEFVDYSVLNYWSCSESFKGDFNSSQSIRDKKSFLKRYPEFSAMRARSADITDKWSYSTIEKRIMSKLGIDSPPGLLAPAVVTGAEEDESLGRITFADNTSESYNTAFGIHIVEHNLLAVRKTLDNDTFLKLTEDRESDTLVRDPYSMQVTALLPGWLDICQKEYFRVLTERLIREEIPAHIAVKVCWVDPYVMKSFEDVYGKYLQYLSSNCFELTDGTTFPDNLNDVVAVMKTVHNIYPPSFIGKSRVHPVTRLNYSTLGRKNSMREGENWTFENKEK